MTAQLNLYRANEQVSAAWSSVLPPLRQLVQHVGLKECAFRCDTSPSMLADALAERKHRHMRVEWVMAIVDAAPLAMRETVLGPWNAFFGFKIELLPVVTPEQELERLRAFMTREAAAALRAYDAETKP